MFDSSEQFKSKTSDLEFYSFYESLLSNFDDDEAKDVSQIFKIFEEFLYSSKDKSVFLTEFSVKKSSQFHNLIKSFCLAYQQKLKKLIEENSYFSKLKKSGLSLEQTVIVSLLFGFILINQLGNEPKRFFRPVVHEQPFAIITSNIAPRPRVTRQHSSIATFQETRANFEDQSNITLAQEKPTQLVSPSRTLPRSVSMGYQRSQKSPVTLYKRSPLLLYEEFNENKGNTNLHQVPENIVNEFLKDEEKFEFLVDYDFKETDRLEKLLSEEFPKSRIRIQPTYAFVKDKWVISNEISVAGSRLQYKVGGEFKKQVKDFIKNNTIFALFEAEIRFERDHTFNSVTRQLVNLSENQGSTILIPKKTHNYLTAERKYTVGKNVGYTPDKGEMITLLDSFKTQDLELLKKYGKTEEGFQSIYSSGTNIEDLLEAYSESHDLDQKVASDILKEDGISDNVLLAVRQDMLLNNLTAKDYDKFVNRYSKRSNYDP